MFMSGWKGIDLSRYDLDDPIGEVESNAIRAAVAAFQEFDDDGREWTVRDIGRLAGIGGIGPVFVGSGATVADRLQEWVDDTDADGFNLAYAVTPGTFEDIVWYVIPVLTERGVYPPSKCRGRRAVRTATTALAHTRSPDRCRRRMSACRWS